MSAQRIALMLFILVLSGSLAALGQTAPTIEVNVCKLGAPICSGGVVTDPEPFDLQVSATFPDRNSTIIILRAKMDGVDITALVLPLLAENITELTDTNATMVMNAVRVAPGMRGEFELSITAEGETATDTLTIDVSIALGAAALRPTGDATGSGRAQLAIGENGEHLQAGLTVAGLPPGSTHASFIHQGFCPPPIGPSPDQQGINILRLNDVNVDDNGNGFQTTEIHLEGSGFTSLTDLLTGDYYINVFLNSSNDAAGIGPGQMCGPIQFNLPAFQAAASLSPAGNSGAPSASASAAIVVDRETATDFDLLVHLEAANLPFDSAHALHIHQGSCAPEGPNPVALALPDVSVGGGGNGSLLARLGPEQVSFGNVAEPLFGGFHLDLHERASDDPVGPGEVLSCGPLNRLTTREQGNGALVPTRHAILFPDGGDASGTAEAVIADNGDQLFVTLEVVGLTPNSGHAAHIHEGFCPPLLLPWPFPGHARSLPATPATPGAAERARACRAIQLLAGPYL